MTPEKFKRKLTAILSADVKGYSRLMGEDEVGTIRTLTAYKEVIAGFIQRHRGRVVGSAGDSVLAEFVSVVDAVQCAVEVQKELKTRNADLPENRRMEFRIGINLGDVVEEGEDILGDGVNIASRVESLAEAGGICISGTAYDQVKNKIALGYEFLGEQTVKNIAEPVRVYRVRMETEAEGRGKDARVRREGKRRRPVALAAVVLVVLAAGLAVWQFLLRPASLPIEKADPKKMAFPLPDKPSIAVLPFANMSDDPKQEFFSDGITEEIITALSKVPNLFVIARHSVFSYKGKLVKVKQVSEELGVRYVLEGSIRCEANRVRITAQFVDALTGYHLWAERYDRDMKQILDLQDEIALKVVTALQVKLQRDHARVMGRGVRNLDAYLKAMEGYERFFHQTKEDNALARKLAEDAIELDPDYARGYTLLAATHNSDVWFGTTKSPKESLERAIELTHKAIALDPSDGKARSFLAVLYAMMRQWDNGFPEADRALALEPNSPETLFNSGLFLLYACKQEEAISLLKKAIRLNPFAPAVWFNFLSVAYRMAGQYDEAIEQAKKAIERSPEYLFPYLTLSTACILTGRIEEARTAAAEVLKINPKFSLEQFARTLPYKDQSQIDRYIDALRKAGLK